MFVIDTFTIICFLLFAICIGYGIFLILKTNKKKRLERYDNSDSQYPSDNRFDQHNDDDDY